MTLTKNIGLFDKILRLLIAEILFIGAYFWLSGVLMVLAYLLATMLVLTSLSGYCPLYRPLHVSTVRPFSRPTLIRVASLLTGLAIAYGGIYASELFTTKFFLEDFNTMHGYYKQTLFNTGQGKQEESLTAYQSLVAEYATFADTYATYRPYVVRSDVAFGTDLVRARRIIADVGGAIESGDLEEAHVVLEGVRPIFQDMLKRNGISLLSVALVDFHDSMERVLSAADAQDVNAVALAYIDADTKLRSVEEVVNDAEIQAIRANLETVRTLAEDGALDALPAAGSALKSSFVKVYLARG